LSFHYFGVKRQVYFYIFEGFGLELVEVLNGPRSRREVGSIKGMENKSCYDIKGRSRIYNDMFDHEIITMTRLIVFAFYFMVDRVFLLQMIGKRLKFG
jgi:hypothetical protein